MKKLIIILLVLGYTLDMSSQHAEICFRKSPLAEVKGDSLELSFSCYLKGGLKPTESLHLQPVYISESDTVRYPEVVYMTPSGARYHKRRLAYGKEKAGEIVRAPKKGSVGDTDYKQRIPVLPSREGELSLLQTIHCCHGGRLIAKQSQTIPAKKNISLPEDVLPLPVAVVSIPLFEANVTFLKPKEEEVKERVASTTIRITYPVNHWRVYPDFERNDEELLRIEKILSPVARDTSTYRILSASIVGYASPEDTYEHNMQLSERRAEGMKEYLMLRYGLHSAGITTHGMGEDWAGLRKEVEKSGMEFKKEILSIIDGYDVFDGREKVLMELHGGDPYRYMLENLFPPLRRMEMEFNYEVKPFDVSEASKLIDIRPQDLSLEEMYEAARSENDNETIHHRRSEYGREYDIAVRYFPGDGIANINASSAALVRGDLEQAWLCLSRVKDNPLADNNRGVYHWLCGKTEEAKVYFERALSTDPERASFNLEELKKWEETLGKE